MRTIILTFFILTASIGIADPSPFGLEIGKTSIADLKKKYSVTKTGINAYSQGAMYDVSTRGIRFEGLRKLSVIFDQKGILVAVLTKLPKHKFNYLLGSLRRKYSITSSQIPFVGNKKVKFQNGNTKISLVSPHLSFTLSMNYISKDFMKSYRSKSRQNRARKRQSESSQL